MILITREEKQALKQTYKMLELSKFRFALAVLVGTASISSTIALNAISAWLIAKASKMPPVLNLTIATVSVRMFGITKALFRYVERILSHDNALSGINNLRENIYKKLASSPIDCVAHIKRGDLFSRASTDIEALGNFVIKSLLPLYVALLSSLVPLAISFCILPSAGIALLIGLLISGVISPLLTVKATRITQITLEQTQTTLVDNTMMIMESGSELVINNQDKKLFSLLEDTEHKIHILQNKAAKLNALASIVDTTGMFFAIASAMILGIPAVLNHGIQDISLAIITLLPLASFESTAMLKPASVQLITSATSAVRIMKLLDQEEQVSNVPILEKDQNSQKIKLKLDNVSTGWNGKTIVENLNFEIDTNTKIGIIGESGIGKSTLLYTLAGMLGKTDGNFTLNDVEITDENRHDLANYVTLITEDSHIFEASIYENIRVVDNTVTEEQAYSFLERAGLKSWIDSIPDGIHTILSQGASSISGGQRRRILLARCYATHTPFILIDEPNEHLDPETTDSLVKDIFNTCNYSSYKNTSDKSSESKVSRGVIVVTHRLTPLENADLIIMLEKDKDTTKIKHIGTHEELCKTSEKYAWLLEQEQKS